jgi:CRP-like cAMP-binding protein
MMEAFKAHLEQVINISDDEFESILSFFSTKTFEKHTYLIKIGEPAPYEYFLLRGLVKAYQTDRSGRQYIVHFGLEGWWILEIEAFQRGTNATLDVECLEDTVVLYISATDKERLCLSIPKMEHFFRVKSGWAHAALQERMLMDMNASTIERYDALIRQDPSLYHRVSQNLLASYLGVTSETLSRLTST